MTADQKRDAIQAAIGDASQSISLRTGSRFQAGELKVEMDFVVPRLLMIPARLSTTHTTPLSGATMSGSRGFFITTKVGERMRSSVRGAEEGLISALGTDASADIEAAYSDLTDGICLLYTTKSLDRLQRNYGLSSVKVATPRLTYDATVAKFQAETTSTRLASLLRPLSVTLEEATEIVGRVSQEWNEVAEARAEEHAQLLALAHKE